MLDNTAVVKFAANEATCVAGGHQCDFVSKFVANLMGDLAKPMQEVFASTKMEHLASQALGSLSSAKFAVSDVASGAPAAQNVANVSQGSSGISV